MVVIVYHDHWKWRWLSWERDRDIDDGHMAYSGLEDGRVGLSVR